jgi:DNA-binding PadR family transcriptional regulator
MTGADVQSFLPLTEATLYILLSLAPGKKHGYAIRQEVEAMSGGRIRLSTSTLYSALGRLLDQTLIARVESDPDAQTGPGLPRKVYVLSALGRRVLQADVDRLQALTATARLRLGEGACER